MIELKRYGLCAIRTGGVSIIKDTTDILDFNVVEAFLDSSINAVEECRNEIISALDRLDTQFKHYCRAIREEKERAKREDQ